MCATDDLRWFGGTMASSVYEAEALQTLDVSAQPIAPKDLVSIHRGSGWGFEPRRALAARATALISLLCVVARGVIRDVDMKDLFNQSADLCLDRTKIDAFPLHDNIFDIGARKPLRLFSAHATKPETFNPFPLAGRRDRIKIQHIVEIAHAPFRI
jgi:hypothetical protein